MFLPEKKCLKGYAEGVDEIRRNQQKFLFCRLELFISIYVSHSENEN